MNDIVKEEAKEFNFLSPFEVSNCQISIPAMTPYQIKHIFKKTTGIKIVVSFKLIDNICYNYDLEFSSLESARAAGWAV